MQRNPLNNFQRPHPGPQNPTMTEPQPTQRFQLPPALPSSLLSSHRLQAGFCLRAFALLLPLPGTLLPRMSQGPFLIIQASARATSSERSFLTQLAEVAPLTLTLISSQPSSTPGIIITLVYSLSAYSCWPPSSQGQVPCLSYCSPPHLGWRLPRILKKHPLTLCVCLVSVASACLRELSSLSSAHKRYGRKEGGRETVSPGFGLLLEPRRAPFCSNTRHYASLEV